MSKEYWNIEESYYAQSDLEYWQLQEIKKYFRNSQIFKKKGHGSTIKKFHSTKLHNLSQSLTINDYYKKKKDAKVCGLEE